jgi:hypothetical protein
MNVTTAYTLEWSYVWLPILFYVLNFALTIAEIYIFMILYDSCLLLAQWLKKSYKNTKFWTPHANRRSVCAIVILTMAQRTYFCKGKVVPVL